MVALGELTERILRVNHAGEHGAVQIYRAQALVCSLLFEDVVPRLHEMLEHERRHLDDFAAVMQTRGVRPCRALGLWALGGFVLGAVTALLGRNAIWACTEAIESSVLCHLNWQLDYLSVHDTELRAVVLGIIADEEDHRDYGLSQCRPGLRASTVALVARASTKLAIWLSERM